MSMSVREIAMARLQHGVSPLATRTGPTPGMGAAPAPTGGGLYGPSQPGKTPWYATTAYKVFLAAAGTGAMALSYSKNKSVPWAIAHGLIGPLYLTYRGVEYARDRGSGARQPRPPQWPRAQLRRIIEDGYGDGRVFSRTDAQMAAAELERREGDWQDFQVGTIEWGE